MRQIFPIGIVLLLLNVGCVVIPTSETSRGRIEPDRLRFIQAGTTTKEEVLLRLGEPAKVWRGEKNFLYYKVTDAGLVSLIPLAPSGGTLPSGPLYRYFHALLIEFDEKDIVKRHEVKIRSLPGTLDTPGTIRRTRKQLEDSLSEWIEEQIEEWG